MRKIQQEDWWDDMDAPSQAQYIKDHPGSKQAQQADADEEEPSGGEREGGRATRTSKRTKTTKGTKAKKTKQKSDNDKKKKKTKAETTNKKADKSKQTTQKAAAKKKKPAWHC